MKRTAFFISDGTGITAEALGHSLLAQFENIEFEQHVMPYIDSPEAAENAVRRINEAARIDGKPPIIFDTIVNETVAQVLAKSDGFILDIFGTYLSPLEKELETKSSYTVGKSHTVGQDIFYQKRIDALSYALENDDGARVNRYHQAAVILTGVSRSGKTPTCLYLALQYGIKAANYPLTEDDLEDQKLPQALRNYRERVFGLTIDPDRLRAIRHERKSNSRYASGRQCNYEVEEAEMMFRRERIPTLNVTDYSVEEIATRIILEKKLERHSR